MTFNRLVVAAGVAGALVTAGPTGASDTDPLEAEAKVDPDGVGNDVRWESLPTVARFGTVHPLTLILFTST